MNQKEKAKELIEKYKPHMYCYMGSGMLSNTYDESVVLQNAVKCSIIAVEEIIENLEPLCISHLGTYSNPKIQFWQEIKKELENYEK